MPRLDRPSLPPRSGAAPTSLVVLVHGYGADGRDLIDMGGAWGDLLPDAAFVAPSAPEPCAQAPVGRQWFDLSDRDPHHIARGAVSATPVLAGIVAEELARVSLPPSRLALVGFSQGTMVALEVGLMMPSFRPAAIVGYSGLFTRAQARDLPEVAEPPPVLLLHGSDDEVIPAGALFASAYGLARAGVPVEWHLSHGLGHGIDEEGLAIGGDFLARALGS